MPPKKRSNESYVWQYMDIIEGGAKCQLCSSEFTISGSTTTSLHNHLTAKHTTVFGNDTNKKQTLDTFGFGPARPCSDSRQGNITVLLAKLIVSNTLPISIVASEELIQLLEFLEPNYKVPCRATMTKRLDTMKAKLEEQVKDELKNESAAVCITTDIHMHKQGERRLYLSMTASLITPDWIMKTLTLADVQLVERHTMSVISTTLDDLAAKWGIKNKVLFCVHDGASNMAHTSATNAWSDVSCSAHKLHLCVTAALGIDIAV